jgi:hypothetical protein
VCCLASSPPPPSHVLRRVLAHLLGRRILVCEGQMVTVFPPQLGRGQIYCEEDGVVSATVCYTSAPEISGEAYVVLPCEGDILVSRKQRHFSPAFCPAVPGAPSPAASGSGDSASEALAPLPPLAPLPEPARAARARQAAGAPPIGEGLKRRGAAAGPGEGRPKKKLQVRIVSG